MARRSAPYTPEFRRQMIELVRSGRSPESLSKEFEPTAQAIRNWFAQAERDAGRRRDEGVTTAERDEIIRLRREVKQLRLERDILSKAAAWFARETDAGHFVQRVLCVEDTLALPAGVFEYCVDRDVAHDPHGVARNLWGTAGPCGACGGRRACR